MNEPDPNQRLMEASGDVVIVNNPVASFIYQLCRDHLPLGTVEQIVRDIEKEEGAALVLTNGWLARYSEDIASRLEKNYE